MNKTNFKTKKRLGGGILCLLAALCLSLGFGLLSRGAAEKTVNAEPAVLGESAQSYTFTLVNEGGFTNRVAPSEGATKMYLEYTINSYTANLVQTGFGATSSFNETPGNTYYHNSANGIMKFKGSNYITKTGEKYKVIFDLTKDDFLTSVTVLKDGTDITSQFGSSAPNSSSPYDKSLSIYRGTHLSGSAPLDYYFTGVKSYDDTGKDLGIAARTFGYGKPANVIGAEVTQDVSKVEKYSAKLYATGGFSNELTTDSDKIYMQYTVKTKGSATQFGVGAAQNHNTYFHSAAGAGELNHSTSGFVTAGETYLFIFDTTATTFKGSYSTFKLVDGKYVRQAQLYSVVASAGYSPTLSKFRGTHIAEYPNSGSTPYEITDISFWDGNGKDLGAVVRGIRSSGNRLSCAEATGLTNRNYTVSMSGAGGFSNKETTTADKMYMTYTVQTLGQVWQAGVGASVNNTSHYFHADGNPGGIMHYIGDGKQDWSVSGHYVQGRTYMLEFDMKSDSFAHKEYILEEGHLWLPSSGTNYTGPSNYASSAKMGAEFNSETFKYRGTIIDGLGLKETVLTNVSCFDSDGNDLGIVVRGTNNVEGVPYNKITAYPEFKVTFKAEGAEDIVKTWTDATKAQFTAPEVPVKQYYDGAWATYELIRDDITVNAAYTAADYTITFKDGDSTVGSPITYNKDTAADVTAPAVPAKEHYNSAWENYELGYNKNLVVNAVHTPINYTITFKNGTEVVEAKTYNAENAAEFTAPAVPANTKEHYEYVWAEYTLNYDNTQVVLLEEKPIVYTVTFKNGNDVVETVSYTVLTENEFEAPAVPAKAHYTGAWETYTLAHNKTQVVNAVYTAIEYTVTFKDGDTVIATKKYTAETAKDFTAPEVPAKEGYTGAWAEFTLAYDNAQVVNAVYTAVESGNCKSNVMPYGSIIIGAVTILAAAVILAVKKSKQN